MPQIIKDRAVVNDDWEIFSYQKTIALDTVLVPEGKVIVPLKVWPLQKNTLSERSELGVWFSSDEQAKELGQDVHRSM